MVSAQFTYCTLSILTFQWFQHVRIMQHFCKAAKFNMAYKIYAMKHWSDNNNAPMFIQEKLMGSLQFSFPDSVKKKNTHFPLMHSTHINGHTDSILHFYIIIFLLTLQKWPKSGELPCEMGQQLFQTVKKDAKTLINLPKFALTKSRNRHILPAFTVMV